MTYFEDPDQLAFKKHGCQGTWLLATKEILKIFSEMVVGTQK